MAHSGDLLFEVVRARVVFGVDPRLIAVGDDKDVVGFCQFAYEELCSAVVNRTMFLDRWCDGLEAAVYSSMFGIEEANALVVADIGFGGCSSLVIFEFRDCKYVDLIFIDEMTSG